MSNPQAQNTPASGGKKKAKKEKKVVDYKVVTKQITDACDAAIKALDPLCWSKKDDEGKDLNPPTDMFGIMLAGEGAISDYKSAYRGDITTYTGSSPRKTLAGKVRDSVSAARLAMIKAYKAVEEAKADVAEAQTTLENLRKLYLSNNKAKLQDKAEKAKKAAQAAQDRAKKLEAELAQA